MTGWILGIDFGTTATAAATANGQLDVVVVDGSPRVASTVVADDDGTLLTGTAAERQAVVAPERAERTPKRRMGDRLILLGDQALAPVDAVAAVLRVVVDEALRRHGGEPPDVVVLTHPVTWAKERLDVLREAAARAGLDHVQLVAEPIAAATQLADGRVQEGEHVAVYDLGGGTFDTAVLRLVDGSFALVGLPGGDDRLGGEYFDERLYQHVGERLAAEDPSAWDQLRTSTDRPWTRANATLRSEVRQAKEALSSLAEAAVYIPAPVDREIRVTRAELESLLAPDIERTVEELERTVTAAGLRLEDLAAVYLTGGSSRIPLVTRLVGQRAGRVPSTWGDPKAVVALGAAATGRRLAGESPVVLERPREAIAPPAPATSARRPNRMLAGVAILIGVVVIAAVVARAMSSKDPVVTAGEVFLEPAGQPGPDPFTEEIGQDVVDLVRFDEAVGGEGGSSGGPTGITTNVGTTPGLYGGTRDNGACDPAQLVAFLGDNPELGQAWAGVLGITPAGIADYVAGLTPLVLRSDVRVTNHGYAGGKATPRQSVLETGTAVLVDRTGVPRVKCGCGNPLVEPVAVQGTTSYTGDRWDGFEPSALAVYREGPPVEEFVVTDLETDDVFVRPAGSAGEADADAPTATGATTTTTEAASGPTTTVADVSRSFTLGEEVDHGGFFVSVKRVVGLDVVCVEASSYPEDAPCAAGEFRSDAVAPAPHVIVVASICNTSVDEAFWSAVSSNFVVTKESWFDERSRAPLGANLSAWRDPTGTVPPRLPIDGRFDKGTCTEGSLWMAQAPPNDVAINEAWVVFNGARTFGNGQVVWTP